MIRVAAIDPGVKTGAAVVRDGEYAPLDLNVVVIEVAT